MKMSVFIILFRAITNEKERVTYDNESFDPCWASVYWWAIVQRQTKVNNPKASSEGFQFNHLIRKQLTSSFNEWASQINTNEG